MTRTDKSLDHGVMTMLHTVRRLAAPLAVALPLLFAVNCDSPPTDPTEDSAIPAGQAQLLLAVNVMATSISTLVVEVTAPDITTPLIFNITESGGVATGTLTIPAGSDRTVTVRAFDSNGIETHRGSITIDVVEGTNPNVSITLLPLTGEQPVTATFGSFAVIVDPPAATITVGATVQLTAIVLDANGDPTGDAVNWASSNPGIAGVDVNGLVTGNAEGDATIVATFNGVGGSALVTVGGAVAQIAFWSTRDGNDEIYLMNADGTALVNLTNDAASDINPAWSPDGSRIAFASNRDGNFEIYVMNADGTGPANLTNHATQDHIPAWSPDGSRIAFTSNRDGNTEIYVMNADGTGPVNLTNHAELDEQPAWSPDGSRIAFASRRDGNVEIYVMNADGTGPVNLTNHAAFDGDATWSPDGSRIAFRSFRDGNNEIYVMNADGTGLVNLTNNTASDATPAWSPDGSRIAFASTRDGNFDIYVMNADGTGVTRITNNPAIDLRPTWRP